MSEFCDRIRLDDASKEQAKLLEKIIQKSGVDEARRMMERTQAGTNKWADERYYKPEPYEVTEITSDKIGTIYESQEGFEINNINIKGITIFVSQKNLGTIDRNSQDINLVTVGVTTCCAIAVINDRKLTLMHIDSLTCMKNARCAVRQACGEDPSKVIIMPGDNCGVNYSQLLSDIELMEEFDDMNINLEVLENPHTPLSIKLNSQSLEIVDGDNVKSLPVQTIIDELSIRSDITNRSDITK